MPQNMSLEELGMLQLLEKISEDSSAPLDRFARYGLSQGGLITDDEPPRLTALGEARLDELRRARGTDPAEDALVPDLDPDPTPA